MNERNIPQFTAEAIAQQKEGKAWKADNLDRIILDQDGSAKRLKCGPDCL